MLGKNNFLHQRKQNLYRKEITYILHQIIQEKSFPFFSLSYCSLSARGENLKVYLTFSPEANREKILKLINKEYSPLIKKQIAKSKKFSYIPTLIFLWDR
jgi:ribosome-binding factor A